MTEPQNFQQTDESDENLNNADNLQHPKHIIKKNLKKDPSRSRSAPADTFENDLESNNYLSSYNYYLYYTKLESPDPRLPKPTYKKSIEKPTLGFIKETKDKEEDDEDLLQEQSNVNEKLIGGLTNEINNLNIQENNPQQNNDLISSNLFNNNFVNNYQKPQENNINTLNYFQSINQPQNQIEQMPMWNEQQNFAMFNNAMFDGSMMGMNQMNPLLVFIF